MKTPSLHQSLGYAEKPRLDALSSGKTWKKALSKFSGRKAWRPRQCPL